MVELITLNQLIVLIITNIIGGIFIGLGIAIGIYRAMKNLMPKWIHEIVQEQRKMANVEKALQGRNY